MITAAAEMDRALRALGHLPGAAERAMARALNGAGVSARAAAIERITARYAVKPEDVRRMIGLSEASPSTLEVAVSARSGSTSLGYFPHAPSRPGTGGRGKPTLRVEILRGALARDALRREYREHCGRDRGRKLCGGRHRITLPRGTRNRV